MDDSSNSSDQGSTVKSPEGIGETGCSILTKVEEKISDLGSSISSFSAQEVTQKLEEGVDCIKKQSVKIQGEIEELIKKHPMLSLSTGLGIGLLIGNRLFGRGHD